MKLLTPSSLVLFAGFLGTATAYPEPEQELVKIRQQYQQRESVLRTWFLANDSPAGTYAKTFILESDFHQLDWRLLASLAMIESGGGKQAPGHNMFGWNNGETTFQTHTEAIHHVADALESASAYKDKTLKGKLRAYNPDPEYAGKVIALMAQISRRLPALAD